jgi:osmotically-inducible protein OsmY
MPVLTHTQLHELVENELSWDPEITSKSIGVVADDGVVTLSGYVGSYAERIAVERAALRVQGVRAVANDLQVKLQTERIDPEIARSIGAALRNHLSIPNTIKAAVRSGHVILEGTVPWMYQKHAADYAVRHVPGVRSVLNLIGVKPSVSLAEVKTKIEDALRRSAETDASHIRVFVNNSEVRLVGQVRSFAEKQDAERAAWAAPGVTKVENQIAIVP